MDAYIRRDEDDRPTPAIILELPDPLLEQIAKQARESGPTRSQWFQVMVERSCADEIYRERFREYARRVEAAKPAESRASSLDDDPQ